MTARPATGHCLCGAIRFEVAAEPLSTNFCHCESCRRHSGGVAAPFATFRKDAVRWSGPERASYRSSPPVVRSFCGRCGSPLAYEHDGSADEIDLYLGAFDDPARFPVGKHVHYGERVAWFDTVDRTPRFHASSGSGEPPVATGPAAG
jgi:hypothetical protein